MEEELGFPLFYRSTRNVSLTKAGMRFLGTSKALSAAFQEGVREALLAEQGYVGNIKIGFLRDTFDAASADVLLAFRVKHPRIHVELIECNHVNLQQSFQNCTIDAVLGTGIELTEEGDSEDHIILFQIDDCAVCAPIHPLAQKSSVHFRDLRNENFIALARTSSAYRHDHLFQCAMNAGFLPNIVTQASFVHGIFMMVASNLGISLLPKNLEYMGKDRVKFVPIDDIPKRTWALYWKKNNISPSLQLFIDTARELSPTLDGA